ncbi:MAG: phosphatidylglycerophosphatase A [Azospirillaceae bacterium]
MSGLLLPVPGGLGARHPAVLVATGLGVGRLPPAPGTWASLAAFAPGAALIALGGTAALIAGIVIATAFAFWAVAIIDRAGDKDPRTVVIDEVVGQWLALLPVAGMPILWPIAFVAFRVFDVAKPWPISWADRRLPGALGVMADDVLAGVAAAAITTLVALFIGGTPWPTT